MQPKALPALALIVAMVTTVAAQSQEEGASAFEGLQKVTGQFGEEVIKKIVQMEGLDGQSQPANWELVVHDPTSEFSLKNYAVSGTKASDQGPNEYLYPNNPPTGFFELSQVQIDSTAAFRILDAEARRSGKSFASVNYLLRCREFTNEPIWDLTAVDAEGYPAGRIHLSASTGSVLRTIWFSWHSQHDKGPTIADSALTSRPAALGYPQAQPQAPAVATTTPPSSTTPGNYPGPVMNPGDTAPYPQLPPSSTTTPTQPPIAEVGPAETMPPPAAGSSTGQAPMAVRPTFPLPSSSSAPVNTTPPASTSGDYDPLDMGPPPPKALRPDMSQGGTTLPPSTNPTPPVYPYNGNDTDPVEVEPLPPSGPSN